MDVTPDIQALIYFRRKSAEAVKHLKATRRPILLTINGRAVVVQDARSYQHLLDIAAHADASEGIRQGLEDVARRRQSGLGPLSKFMTWRSTGGFPARG